MIAIDRSGSNGTDYDEQKAWCDDGNDNALRKTLDKRSRIDAVKQVFYAFRDRTETLGKGKHKIGLIQFDNEIETMLDLTIMDVGLSVGRSVDWSVTESAGLSIGPSLFQCFKDHSSVFAILDPRFSIRGP